MLYVVVGLLLAQSASAPTETAIKLKSAKETVRAIQLQPPGNALDAPIHDTRLKTAVMCYGRVTTDPKLLASLDASVLAIFAGKDEGIPPTTIEQFKKAMQKAGKSLTAQVYPKCGNGFMDPN